jgi:hypothetical protein
MNKSSLKVIRKFVESTNVVKDLTKDQLNKVMNHAKREYNRMPRNKRFEYKKKLKELT